MLHSKISREAVARYRTVRLFRWQPKRASVFLVCLRPFKLVYSLLPPENFAELQGTRSKLCSPWNDFWRCCLSGLRRVVILYFQFLFRAELFLSEFSRSAPLGLVDAFPHINLGQMEQSLRHEIKIRKKSKAALFLPLRRSPREMDGKRFVSSFFYFLYEILGRG